MRVDKKYIAKIEKTLYIIETVEILAESEREAEDVMRDGGGVLIDTDIQDEEIDRRWIDSSEPIEDWDMLPDVEDLERIVNREVEKLKEYENGQT